VQQAGASVLEVLSLTAPLCILSLVLSARLSATAETRMQALWRSSEEGKRAAMEACSGGVVGGSADVAISPYFFQASGQRLMGPEPVALSSRSAFLCNEPDRPLAAPGQDAARRLFLNGFPIDVAIKDHGDDGPAVRSPAGQSFALFAVAQKDAPGADADGVPRPPGFRLWSLIEPDAGYMLIAYQVSGMPEAALSQTLERLTEAGFSREPGETAAGEDSSSLIYAVSRQLPPGLSDSSSGQLAGQGREVVVSVKPYGGVMGMSLVIYLVRHR
jgi:hypothetical protein